MSALTVIARAAAEKNLSFVVAGGHAVVVHGYPRNTFDLDLIVSRDDETAWKKLAAALGYTLYREGPTFLQFNPPGPDTLPLDLMLVEQKTFSKLMTEAAPAPAAAPGVKIVSLLHLLALKCHAIKHGHSGRTAKDADDVIRLTQANRLEVNDPKIRELFLKHGTVEYMRKSDKSATNRESGDVEFPDWSGMDESPTRVSPDAAFQLCEQYSKWFPEAAQKWQSQRPEKCLVEFKL